MKVGILTLHWSDNYGAVLQVYALVTTLKKLGHDVYVLDYRPHVKKPYLWLFRRLLGRTPKACVLKWKAFVLRHHFEQFRKQHLVLSSRCVNRLDELTKISDKFDVLITGSDQVWNPRFFAEQTLMAPYLLDFGNREIRRVSYAASFGHSSKRTMGVFSGYIGRCLKKLDFISVRESSGINVVAELTERHDVTKVADPTLLLDDNEYRNLFRSSLSQRCGRRQGIFSYILHEQEMSDCYKMIANTAQHLFASPVTFCRLGTGLESTEPYRVRPTPQEWLSQIKGACFVITNSFHGLIFCLISHTPFVCIPVVGHKETMNDRVGDLLTSVGLDYRLICDPNADVMKRSIDWSVIDAHLQELKESGLDFLKKSI